MELSNVSGDNDTIATAESLGALGAAPLVVNGFISTADDDDIDFYSFSSSAWESAAVTNDRAVPMTSTRS